MKNTIMSTFLALVLSLIFVGCGGSEGTGDGEGQVCESCGIYGHVSDYDTGEDVANANIQLRPGGDTTLTGSDGMFEFRELPSGDYSITVSKAGYTDLIDDFVITVHDRMVRRDVQIVNECKEGYCCKKTTPCIDPDTNYMWSSLARKDMDWDSAMAYCDNLSEGGYSDWSLPSKEVLESFYNGDDNRSSKLGDTGYFWSSTPCYTYDNSIYVVDLSYVGLIDSCGNKSYAYSVRCVRW